MQTVKTHLKGVDAIMIALDVAAHNGVADVADDEGEWTSDAGVGESGGRRRLAARGGCDADGGRRREGFG
jgi:hypothetical protein